MRVRGAPVAADLVMASAFSARNCDAHGFGAATNSFVLRGLLETQLLALIRGCFAGGRARQWVLSASTAVTRGDIGAAPVSSFTPNRRPESRGD